jgi:calcium-dependent protein kinase
MLVRDPSKRATATDILNHDWVKENGVAGDVEIEPEVGGRGEACMCVCVGGTKTAC